MGIYDRDYYRERKGFSAFDARIQACMILAGVFVAMFLLQALSGNRVRLDPFTSLMMLDTQKVLQGEIWRIFTYSFLQTGSLIGLLFNCLFLVWFGRAIEGMVGWLEFLAYYLLAGIIGGVGFLLTAIATQEQAFLIGPGACVTAVLFLYALHYPRQTVLVMFVLPCPIWFLVGFYTLADIVGFAAGTVQPGKIVAHALAAGFAVAYFRYSWRITRWLPGMPSGERKVRKRTSLHIYRDDDTRAPATVSSSAASAQSPSAPPAPVSLLDEHLEAKLDEVLEKVKKHGQESLSEEERAVLFRASEIYRKRRKTAGD